MKISDIITDWYKKNQRNLPWRQSRDPYTIWVSEVILQQTRVNQGIEYYYRFVKRFPNVFVLAEADEQDVLRQWQGLGYYSRARNMHHAAKQVVSEYNGRFPEDYKQLITLKGIGLYTAAAVSSIAFGEPVPVIDGNVSRVISRLFNITTPVNSGAGMKEIRTVAETLLDQEDPGAYNQGIMEFGALYCVPKNPDCTACPLQVHCMAYKVRAVSEIPVKIKKPRARNRYFYYFIIGYQDSIYIVKRENKDIWQNLYDFPHFESKDINLSNELDNKIQKFTGLEGDEYKITGVSDIIRHQLTHQTIHAAFIRISVFKENYPGNEKWLRVLPEEVSDYPVPRLIERYLEGID